MKTHVIGIDLGGTKIMAGVFDIQGNLLSESCRMTGVQHGVHAVLDNIAGAAMDAWRQLEISTRPAIACLACPGPLDIVNGITLRIHTLGFDRVPIRNLIMARLDMELILENDANAAAYGEFRMGAMKGRKNAAYVTISTGVGCGLIADGRIYRGSHGFAGELGHVCVDPDGETCNCGKTGCLQAYSSGPAIVNWFRRYAHDRFTMTCQEVETLASSGNKEALQAFGQAGRMLGRGLASLVQIVDPECIVIGGGVSSAFQLMKTAVHQEMVHRCQYDAMEHLAIHVASLGPRSGMIGASQLAIDAMKGKG